MNGQVEKALEFQHNVLNVEKQISLADHYHHKGVNMSLNYFKLSDDFEQLKNGYDKKDKAVGGLKLLGKGVFNVGKFTVAELLPGAAELYLNAIIRSNDKALNNKSLSSEERSIIKENQERVKDNLENMKDGLEKIKNYKETLKTYRFETDED